MASFLQKRLRCFYCGRRSTQSQKGPIRQFQCRDCQAVNYLDENGEITDPPVNEASLGAPVPQYAQPVSRSGSQEPSADSSIFCSTCVKNQYLLTQTLASYLPPTSHPEYAAYEASYPAYRKSLEERYPQVCAQCEPRVRNRIREAGYAAKSDHLRRMMERSRGGRHRAHGWNWRSLLVATGAVSFWASVAGQLAWNLAGSIATEHLGMETQDSVSLFSITTSCVRQGLKHRQIADECTSVVTPYAGLALFLGVASIWWNPRLRHKVEGKGRITGMREYYKIQIVVLVVRFVAWACLQDQSITGLDPRLPPAIHAFMGLFTIISVVLSRRIIIFDTTPLFTWQDNVEPLLPQENKLKPATRSQLASPPASQTSFLSTENVPQRFPINSLAHIPSSNPAPFYIPPTPPLDPVDDTDAMDWTPSQQSFQPKVTPRHLDSPALAGPSPFQGNLPAAPKPPSWQLRNPASQSAIKPIEQKLNPFRNAPVLQPTSNKREPAQAATEPEPVMAPPRFFPPSDYATDTGLESLFDKTFSIAEEPTGIRKQRWPLRAKANNHGPAAGSASPFSRIFKTGLLAGCLVIWATAQFFELPGKSVETIVLGIAFLVAGFSLLGSLMRPMAMWSAMDIILPLLELVACAYLATHLNPSSYDRYVFDRAGKSLVAFMIGQEMINLRSFSFSPKRPAMKQDQPKQHSQRQQAPSARLTVTAPAPKQTSNTAKSPNTGISSTLDRHSFTSSSNLNYETRPTLAPAPSFGAGSFRDNNFNTQNSNGSVGVTHPPPFSAIPYPPHSPSFSSFGSAAMQDNPVPTISTTSISTTSYASSSTPEPPSPQKRAAVLASPLRGGSSQAISSLNLEDKPAPSSGRYTLRTRRSRM
ncbi:hypothetical protein AJ80_00775 [Polytolypa hystricis UAMH7299]|uniref:Ima1 N-terminal domain-containing protein n=1 Tax=Polytolypa hystricis (strain UAMH7299) TaxID=1447883 RepID=A0A2B7YU08_POLH7|nr:hypothetical protein AJ80_00775 [Polytolypa hystricis UAMH7299]